MDGSAKILFQGGNDTGDVPKVCWGYRDHDRVCVHDSDGRGGVRLQRERVLHLVP